MATPPPELDPEVALQVARITDEHLMAMTGGATLRRTVYESTADGLRLGWRLAEAALAARRHGGSLLSVAEYAARAGLSVRTVQRQVTAGGIPARRVGRDWVIDIEAED